MQIFLITWQQVVKNGGKIIAPVSVQRWCCLFLMFTQSLLQSSRCLANVMLSAIVACDVVYHVFNICNPGTPVSGQSRDRLGRMSKEKSRRPSKSDVNAQRWTETGLWSSRHFWPLLSRDYKMCIHVTTWAHFNRWWRLCDTVESFAYKFFSPCDKNYFFVYLQPRSRWTFIVKFTIV